MVPLTVRRMKTFPPRHSHDSDSDSDFGENQKVPENQKSHTTSRVEQETEIDIEEGNEEGNCNMFGKFPKPIYNAEQMKKVNFPMFCFCNNTDHNVFNIDKDSIDVSCYHYMAAVNRVCQNQNCWIGKILYRGSKVIKYDHEICTFRRDTTKDQRMSILQNLLLVSKHLTKETPDVFSDQSDMLTSIQILGLMHQYEDVFNDVLDGGGKHTKERYIATPLLNCTKDLRVAASMAMDHHSMTNQGVVRILLIPPPTPVVERNGSRQESWKEFKIGSYVKRLGNTNMLFIDFEIICPAFARRPLNQKVYFIIDEEDLINFHMLRLSGIELDGISVFNTEDEFLQSLKVESSTRAALYSLVDNEEKWDALHWRVVDVRIPGAVMKEDFFHGYQSTYKNEKGQVKVVMENPSPLLSPAYLYPERDPMKEVMIKIAQQINKVNLDEVRPCIE